MTTPGEDAILEAARAEGREKLRAGIYTRMSLARMDDQTKTGDQERICRGLCEQRGWDVAAVYTDNNRSAWQRDRKRPGWDAMLRDVETGRVNAIVVYHGDRLARQPWDMEKLIHLADAKGIRLASPTGTRNLDNPDDRFIIRIEAAHDCRSSDDTSRRQKARFERWRREGKVMAGGRGGRRFGFATDGVTHVPAECDAVREIARRVLAGESNGAVAADLAARGVRSPAGKLIDRSSIKRMLRNPRYAGLMPDGESAGAWEPVLDRQTWERARLAVEARAAGYARGPRAARWLLSGIAACGAPGCGATMSIAYITSRGYRQVVYACRKRDSGGCGKVYRNAAHLELYVSARVVHLLNDPRQPQGVLPAPPERMPEWAALEREQAETAALLADYAASAGRARVLMARLDSIEARMGQLREREAGDARSRLLGRYRGITLEQFGGLPLDVRRALVAASYRVTVLPASKRGPGFRTEDVRLEPAR